MEQEWRMGGWLGDGTLEVSSNLNGSMMEEMGDGWTR